MKAFVLAAFGPFATRFEGRLGFMYTDKLGLVTTGIGNKIDDGPSAPPGATSAPTPWRYAEALTLPWKHADGSPANTGDIAAEWHAMKLAWPSVQSSACRALATLHLDPADIDHLVAEKAHENDDALRAIFANFDALPADAQLAIHSMAWAMGTEGVRKFVHLVAAVNRGDFREAAAQCHMQGVGIADRNAANVALFTNAAVVTETGGDPETLWFPHSVTAADVPAGGGWKPFAAIGASVVAAGLAAWAIVGRGRS
ncbi:MAG: hypothetical protein M3O46_19920 [Myxococcota bacterium]|nr:hypothetical protein [Myxococcota bacterium]